MARTRPLILLSNDDGYSSPGIRALAASLGEHADIVIVAPETEQSATSHALSLHHPLRLRRVDKQVFALDGTPADCVYVALHAGQRVLPRRPDLVASGLNHGLNLGQDVFYSGTVAAAREGALRGIPAIAASAHSTASLEAAATFTTQVALELLKMGPYERGTPLLNVNIPKDWMGEVRATRLGERIYEEIVDFRKDPRGREYLWLGGPGVRHEKAPGTDTDAFDEGVASITPLILDLTCAADAPLAFSLATATGTKKTE
jgi:5'/3'-nucleotidase